MKKYLCVFFILFLRIFFFGFSLSQNSEKPQVVKVDSNLFAVVGPGGNGNAAFLITEEGVAVIDTGESPEMGRQFLALIQGKTDKPIRYIFLTHYHGDHTLGLQSFPETAIVIGHKNLYRNMKKILLDDMKDYPEYIENLQKKVEEMRKQGSSKLGEEEERLKSNMDSYERLKDVRIILPDLTFENKLVIRLGEEMIEIYHPGSTHTSGSSVVYFPGRKTIHMGDMLFAGSHSYIDGRAAADTRNWISFLRQVQDWDVEKIIPGHGPLGGKDDLEKEIMYLKDLRKEVAAAIQKGMTLEEAKKAVRMESYKDYKWPEMLPLIIEAVYQELLTEREQTEKKSFHAGQSLVIQSAHLNESRDIFVHLPDGYETSDKRYPVLYVLDAEDVFDYAVGAVDFLSISRMPEMIVVGIPNTNRERDLWVNLEPDGGYTKFIGFLENELIPHIDKNFRTHPYRVFYGFCSGAGTVLWILFTHPEMFEAYIASGTGFDQTWSGIAQQAFKERPDLKKSFFAVTEGTTMRADGVRMLRQLLEESAPSGLSWECEIMDGEEHGPVLARGLFSGLRFVFRGWKLPEDVAAGGPDAIKKYYDQLSRDYGFETGIPEQSVLSAGSSLFWRGKRKEAIEVFEFMTEEYPNSPDAFEMLGLAYEEENQLEHAKKAYEAAVQKARENSDRRLPRFEEYLANIRKKMKGSDLESLYHR